MIILNSSKAKSSADELPQHVVQDASILEVFNLHVSVQSQLGGELLS